MGRSLALPAVLLVGGLTALFVILDPFGDPSIDPDAVLDLAPLRSEKPAQDNESATLQGRPLIVLPRDEPMPPEFLAALRQARTLIDQGKHVAALAVLAPWREKFAEAFDRPDNARFLARLEAGAKRERERIAKDEAEALDARAVRYKASRDIAGLAEDPEDRRRLQEHIDRFVPRSGSEVTEGGETSDEEHGIEEQFQTLLSDREAWRSAATPLAVVDAEAQEARRVEQLQRLAARGGTELLEPLHGALVWLALHQGEDGRFSDGAVDERCVELKHMSKRPKRKGCTRTFRTSTSERYAVASTALALMALLDFRDQDARGVFEPHIARGLTWLRAKQQADGTFGGKVVREFYTTAMALMAMGQAAASSADAGLRSAVAKGLASLYTKRGSGGGYRYAAMQAGDISVTGWVAQAVEAARWAEVEIPHGMEDQLRYFLDGTWLGGERFNYTIGRGPERPNLFPVGMLMGHILWEDPHELAFATWRTWLANAKAVWQSRPPLYTLYYGLRISLLLEGGLKDPWTTWVGEMVKLQEKKGGAAGMFSRDLDHWTSLGGSVVITALAALTLEHALYER